MRARALVFAAASVLAAPGVATAQQPTTTRASVTSTGAQASGASRDPQISADGRWVAFRSEAALVAPDTGVDADVFLRDRLSGETQRISTGRGGVEADASSPEAPSMTADGRYVAFTSDARNLVAGGATGRQLFLYDRFGGVLRVAAILPPGVSSPSRPSISDDGSRVVFDAFTGGLRTEVFVTETATAAVRRVSQTAAGLPADASSAFPDISGDGRWAAYETGATNLAPPDTNGVDDVVATNLATGEATRISVGTGGGEANQPSGQPAMSHDGCVVAFSSKASNLAGNDDGSGLLKVFVRNRCQPETEIVSLSNAAVQGIAGDPDISADGCFVLFTAGPILSPQPAAGRSGLGLRDRCAGVTSRIDVATSGEPADGGPIGPAAVSATGRYVAFADAAANLVGNDSNGQWDVFVRDRAANLRPRAQLRLAQTDRRVTADAADSADPDGPTLTGRIAFGDGTAEADGLSAVHDYQHAGTFTVTATVTDSDGATSSTSSPITVPDPAPAADPEIGGALEPPTAVPPASTQTAPLRLDAVRLSPDRFRVARRGARAGGSLLTLRLSDPATISLRFARAQPRRYVAEGTLRRTLPAGTSTVAVTGRLGARALRSGRHRLTVSARSRDGRRSATRTLTLTVLRRRR